MVWSRDIDVMDFHSLVPKRFSFPTTPNNAFKLLQASISECTTTEVSWMPTFVRFL